MTTTNNQTDSAIVAAMKIRKDVRKANTELSKDNLPVMLSENNLPAIPAKPVEIKNFIDNGKIQIAIVNEFLKLPSSKVREDYETVQEQARKFTGVVLTAEYKMAEVIKSSPKGISKIRKDLDVSRKKWLQIKELTPEAIKETIDEADRLKEIPTRYRALQIARDAIKQAKQEAQENAELETMETSDTTKFEIPENHKFEILYADLAAQTKPLKIEEIQDLKIPVSENAVLFLWADSKKLNESFKLIESLGFEYQEQVVWNKDKLGFGKWSQNMHENLLIATKGTAPTPDKMFRLQGVFFERRTDYSITPKPDYFYSVIEKMYRDKPCLEIFSNRKYSQKWAQFNK